MREHYFCIATRALVAEFHYRSDIHLLPKMSVAERADWILTSLTG
jgi:hypothetical protein